MIFKRSSTRRCGHRSIPAHPIIWTAAFLLSAVALEAQVGGGDGSTARGEIVDRVIAVAGDSVVLLSQVRERVLQMESDGQTIPRDDAEAMKRLESAILDELIDDLLLLQAALKDSTISVADDDVERAVDQQVDETLRGPFRGNQEDLLRALDREGLTMEAWRGRLREELRRTLLQQRYLGKHTSRIKPVAIPEAEVRAAFEERKDRLGERPASVTFRQIVLQPTPSDSSRKAARGKAEDILAIVRSGEESFEELADRFTEDPGGKGRGGDLGWQPRTGVVQAFGDALFSMSEGQVSEVVETEYGLHIIKLEKIRGRERKARHILILQTIAEADLAAYRELAADIKRQIEGGSDLDGLVEEYGDPRIADSLTVAKTRLGELGISQEYAASLTAASAGDILGPFQWGPPYQPNIAVAKALAVREAGEYTLEDVEADIRRTLRESGIIREIVAGLRETSYVKVLTSTS